MSTWPDGLPRDYKPVTHADITAIWKMLAKQRRDSGDQRGAQQAARNVRATLPRGHRYHQSGDKYI